MLSDWRILLRRWYIVVAGLLATASLVVLAARTFPAEFDSTATVLMLPPQSVVDGKPTNPFLGLGGLDGIADVLSEAMSDSTVQQAVAADGLPIEYSLGRDLTMSGPVIVLQVTAESADDALRGRDFLLDRLPGRLSDLQESVGVAERSRITSTVITSDDTASINRRGQIRALLVAVVGGVALTYLVAALVDGIVLARRRAAARALQPRRTVSAVAVPPGTTVPGGSPLVPAGAVVPAPTVVPGGPEPAPALNGVDGDDRVDAPRDREPSH